MDSRIPGTWTMSAPSAGFSSYFLQCLSALKQLPLPCAAITSTISSSLCFSFSGFSWPGRSLRSIGHITFLHSMFLLIHDLGMFRLYERFPFGLEYDYWVHILFGIVSSFIIMHFYSSKKGHGRWHVIILSIFLILGFSAAHRSTNSQGQSSSGR